MILGRFGLFNDDTAADQSGFEAIHNWLPGRPRFLFRGLGA
jgi:hypothetical protein